MLLTKLVALTSILFNWFLIHSNEEFIIASSLILFFTAIYIYSHQSCLYFVYKSIDSIYSFFKYFITMIKEIMILFHVFFHHSEDIDSVPCIYITWVSDSIVFINDRGYKLYIIYNIITEFVSHKLFRFLFTNNSYGASIIERTRIFSVYNLYILSN